MQEQDENIQNIHNMFKIWYDQDQFREKKTFINWIHLIYRKQITRFNTHLIINQSSFTHYNYYCLWLAFSLQQKIFPSNDSAPHGQFGKIPRHFKTLECQSFSRECLGIKIDHSEMTSINNLDESLLPLYRYAA